MDIHADRIEENRSSADVRRDYIVARSRQAVLRGGVLLAAETGKSRRAAADRTHGIQALRSAVAD